jgi:hypothetical protein
MKMLGNDKPTRNLKESYRGIRWFAYPCLYLHSAIRWHHAGEVGEGLNPAH